MDKQEAIEIATKKKNHVYCKKWYGDVIDVYFRPPEQLVSPGHPLSNEGEWVVRFAWIGKSQSDDSIVDDYFYGQDLVLVVDDGSGRCKRSQGI